MLERKIYRKDMLKCALCGDAPCSKACGRIDPAALLRSIWFENEDGAARKYPDDNPCLNCDAPCEEACLKKHEVPVRELMLMLHDEVKPELELNETIDENRLKCDFCGKELENPFFLSSSVVASNRKRRSLSVVYMLLRVGIPQQNSLRDC